MNLNEAKLILNNNGYFLKEDARRNSADLFGIFHLIDVHDDWSPEWVAEEIMKHYYEHDESITVDYINEDNYKDYIGEYINVKGNVNFDGLDLTKLPIRFGTVGGNFSCEDNNLTSLDGAPKVVGGIFNCNINNLTSLEGAPEKVGGTFFCSFNKLTSLEGAPEKVGGHFICEDNKLTSLDGAPKKVGGDFDCKLNKVKFTENDVRKVSNVDGEIIV